MRLLVVDDDQAVRGIVVDLVTLLGHAAHEVSSGPEALALLQTERFDAILLDHQMPEMTGVEVFEQLRAMGSDVAVGFMTGSRGHPHVEKLRHRGVPVIFKPFGWTDFRAFLQRLQAFPERLHPVDRPPPP